MTEALTLNRVQTGLHPAALEQSCCGYLIERVQAIWDAFCSFISLLFTQNATPTAIPKQELTPQKSQEQPLEVLVAEYDLLFQERVRSYGGSSINASVPVDLPISERAAKIKEKINALDLLHFVANPRYTPHSELNRTECLLKLGADPNNETSHMYTPLYCAVLTGSFLAYKTLREHGANPWAYHYNSSPGTRETPIEIAYQILASNEHVADFCKKTLANLRQGLHWHIPREFQSKEQFGSLENVGQMIDYETARVAQPIHAAIGHILPLSLAKLVGAYYLTGNRGESAEIVVRKYLEFNKFNPNGMKEVLAANPQATVEEQLDQIRISVQTSQELFSASSYLANEHQNLVELFLELGANPNMQAQLGTHKAFTPLHAAALTGSLVAYRTLREWGANPNTRLSANEEGENCIELAANVHSAAIKPQIYFLQFLDSAGIPIGEKSTFFPKIYTTRPVTSIFASYEEYGKIVAYEEERQLPRIQKVADQITELWQITQPLAMLIAQYAKYYI